MGEEDITEEILRDLPPAVASTVREAIGRRRAEAALGVEGRDMLREVRDTATRIEHAIATMGERVARLEAGQEAQSERTALFWSRDWPGIERRMDSADRRSDEIEAQIGDLAVEMRGELRAIRDARGVVYEAAAGLCKATTELIRLVIDRPAAMWAVVTLVVLALGLGVIVGGGELGAAWGDWSVHVATERNEAAGEPVLAPMAP